MNFIDTINNLSADQDDPHLNKIVTLIKKDPDFPKTNDMEILAKYLYLKLDRDLTLAYQKTLLFWLYQKNGNQKSSDPALLGRVNYIVELQNNDPSYPF